MAFGFLPPHPLAKGGKGRDLGLSTPPRSRGPAWPVGVIHRGTRVTNPRWAWLAGCTPRCGQASMAHGGVHWRWLSFQAKTSGKFSSEELDKLWRELQHHKEKVQEYNVLLETLSRTEGAPRRRPWLQSVPEQSCWGAGGSAMLSGLPAFRAGISAIRSPSGCLRASVGVGSDEPVLRCHGFSPVTAGVTSGGLVGGSGPAPREAAGLGLRRSTTSRGSSAGGPGPALTASCLWLRRNPQKRHQPRGREPRQGGRAAGGPRRAEGQAAGHQPGLRPPAEGQPPGLRRPGR